MGVNHSHDHTHSVDDAMSDSASGIRAVKISLAVLGVTAVAQLAIVAVSGSVALLADTVHNFSDAATAVPLWVAFSISRRSATRRYTYGFGRVEDLAGLFVLAVIAVSAAVAVIEAIRRLVNPVPLSHLGWVAVAGVGIVLVYAARDVFGRLLDRVDPELVDRAAAVLADQPGVRGVRRVRMRWVGHRLEADAELDVDPTLSLSDAHSLAHNAEHELGHSIPKLGSVIVHAYPAHDSALSI